MNDWREGRVIGLKEGWQDYLSKDEWIVEIISDIAMPKRQNCNVIYVPLKTGLKYARATRLQTRANEMVRFLLPTPPPS
jgi:hypothetical protein